MKNKDKLELTKSSGNIFKDLGLPNPEEYSVKAKFACQINQLFEKQGLNQKEAAHLLGVDQPKISTLSRGQLAGFSVERLFRFLAILNQDIEIIITPRRKNKKSIHMIPRVSVRYASIARHF